MKLDPLSPSRKMREGLADETAPVLVYCFQYNISFPVYDTDSDLYWGWFRSETETRCSRFEGGSSVIDCGQAPTKFSPLKSLI